MCDLESDQTNICIICLDNDIKKVKKYCLTYNDKIEKINCDCNVYCHSRCIKDNIFIYNNGNQKCIICKKDYYPLYKKNYEFSKKQNILIFFCEYLLQIYTIIIILLFYFIFYLFSGYLLQFIRYIIYGKFLYNPFNFLFYLPGILFTFLLFLCLTKFNPDNTNNIFVKIFDSYLKMFRIY